MPSFLFSHPPFIRSLNSHHNLLSNNHFRLWSHHFLYSLLITLFFLSSPCQAYPSSPGSSGMPLFIKLIFIFFGVLFLVVFLIILRRILAMRRAAALGGTVVHYQNSPHGQIFVQSSALPSHPSHHSSPPGGFVTTISTGSVMQSTQTAQTSFPPSSGQIGFVYPPAHSSANGQVILSSHNFPSDQFQQPQSVYFPAPHQPPAPDGFNGGSSLAGAPPPYYPVAPPDHQSYSK